MIGPANRVHGVHTPRIETSLDYTVPGQATWADPTHSAHLRRVRALGSRQAKGSRPLPRILGAHAGPPRPADRKTAAGMRSIRAGAMTAPAEDELAWWPRYGAAGMRVFPVNAARKPLVRWKGGASSDPAVIEGWRTKYPHADPAWAIPAGIVVIDLDEKNGKHGLRDFKERAGCDPRDVMTPMATTPTGGLHLVYAALRPYKNAAPAIAGTGIDVRALGGLVVLPQPGNGRQWLRPLIGADGPMAPLLPAPAWLDCALRPTPQARAPLMLAPRAALAPAAAPDQWAQKKAQVELERACAKIVSAPCGAQDATRHAQCFFLGSFIANGDIGYATAYEALLAAALAMPAYREPWRNLKSRVARSIEAGMAAPLALSETEQWVRNFRARMRAKLLEARHGC